MTTEQWLEFGGLDLRRISLIAGSTPFFAYSRQSLGGAVAGLRSAFPEGISFYYSLKANHWEPIVFTLSPHVDGFDVSSESELRTALATGKRADRVQLSGPGKSVHALRSAVAAGAVISVESRVELRRIKEIAREVGTAAEVIL